MKKIENYLQKYNQDFLEISNINKDIQRKIIKLIKMILNIKKNKKKIIIVGNSGNAANESNYNINMTKNELIRLINNEEYIYKDLFSNDYGYENWVKEALKFYSDNGDLIILISSSGNSLNMINAAKFAK